MIASVEGYKNTGLTPGNSMDSINLVRSLNTDKITFSDIAIKQSRGLFKIRLSTSYNNIKDVDYIIIEDEGYWVTSVVMLNDNVCELSLLYDVVTSIGISNITNISGWLSRATVKKDGLFLNSLPEDFVPTRPLILEIGGTIYPDTEGNSSLGIVVSTVDLSETIDTAKLYKYINIDDPEDKSGCYVPEVPQLSTDKVTNYTFYLLDDATTENLATFQVSETPIPCTSAFQLAGNDMFKNIRALYELSLDNTLVASYILPSGCYSEAQIGGIDDLHYVSLKGANKQVQRNINPDYEVSNYTIKNKKVFSGQFNKYNIISILSGESMEFDFDSLAYESNIVGKYNVSNFIFVTDPRYNGYPMVYPLFYKGAVNKLMLCTVKGAPWQSLPISSYKSGAGLALLSYRKQSDAAYDNKAINYGASIANSLLTKYTYDNRAVIMGSNGLEGVGGYYEGHAVNIPTPKQTAGFMQDINGILRNERDYNDMYTNAYNAPQINFNQTPTLQNYIGNCFFDYRIRLSDEDTKRFDAYLTAFGYRVDEPLDKSIFGCRTKFEYIKGYGINLQLAKGTTGDKINFIRELENGVRIWHVKPTYNFYNIDNSIREDA